MSSTEMCIEVMVSLWFQDEVSLCTVTDLFNTYAPNIFLCPILGTKKELFILIMIWALTLENLSSEVCE